MSRRRADPRRELARIGQPSAGVLRAQRGLETAIRLGNAPLELRARLALLPALSDRAEYRTVVDAAADTIALADALDERVAADRARIYVGRALALLGRYDAAETALCLLGRAPTTRPSTPTASSSTSSW